MKTSTHKIHFFASTGANHLNGTVTKKGAKPSEQQADKLARAAAQKFASDKGGTLKEFSVRLIGK